MVLGPAGNWRRPHRWRGNAVVFRSGCIWCFVFLPFCSSPTCAVSALRLNVDIRGVGFVCMQGVPLEHRPWIEPTTQTANIGPTGFKRSSRWRYFRCWWDVFLTMPLLTEFGLVVDHVLQKYRTSGDRADPRQFDVELSGISGCPSPKKSMGNAGGAV